MSRRRWIGLARGLGLLVLAPTARWIAAEGEFRRALDSARRELEAGNAPVASEALTRLEGRWPGRAEVAYWLGVSEERLGRRDAALAAWSRVPPGPPFGARAAAGRGTILIDTGRYTQAEDVLTSALGDTGSGAWEVRRALGRLYRFECRLDELRGLLERSWGLALEPSALLVEHWELDDSPFPIDGVRRVLGAAAPGDDRVVLGRANLAVLTGHFAEADAWLAECRAKRPDDEAVWRGRLGWALAVQDAGRAREALAHLRANGFSNAKALALWAWFASRSGDSGVERAALEALVADDPGAAGALTRLAEIALAAGRPEEAARLRGRRDELGRVRERYRKLLAAGRATGPPEELARLAGSLGRRFEARGWARLASGTGPEPGPPEPAGPSRGGRTMADVLRSSDAKSDVRPATVAGAGADSPVEFADDAEAAGLRFTFESGRGLRRQLPETMSGGVAVLDYDGDGRLDVFAVQGGTFPRDPMNPPPGDRLFRNKGDGTFEDVTERSGIARMARGYGHGVAVGDVDNDGHPDLFVTRWRAYALYRNKGDGTFEDITARSGLDGDRDWPTSAAFADLDGDGDLDLYVCHYLKWDAEDPRICADAEAGVNKYCDPREFEAMPDHVFRNDGGRFVDVSREAGVVDRDGRGLGVVAADLDEDGRVDLFVANDMSANLLFRNLGGFRFEEVGRERGVAVNAEGRAQAGMGIACGDLDGDGRPDLCVTNFFNEATTFYRNLGGGQFGDDTAAAGLAASTRYRLGFGAAFLDADADGRLDLMTANGHVNDSRPYFPFAMPAQLLRGVGGGRLVDISDRAGVPWKVLRVGRGLATGDLDGDGRVDAVLLAQDEPLAYFHNRTRGGHWLSLALEGTASNRDGVGARVAVAAGGRTLVGWRTGGGSYQSAGAATLHFGLGASDRVESIEVRWPSGRLDRFPGPPIDAAYRLREGAPAALPLAGIRR